MTFSSWETPILLYADCMAMPKFKFQRMYYLFSRMGVPVYAHWSVVALCLGVIIAMPVVGLPMVVLGLALLILMLLHEFGHAFLVQRLGYEVDKIELYPIHGWCLHDAPCTAYEDYVIAWGGVLAQLILLLPAIVFLKLFGNRPYGIINAILLAFGPINLWLVIVNLAPIPPLDGSKAWRIVPAWIKSRWVMIKLRRNRWRRP